MNEKLMSARRVENYKEYIRNILSNRDIDCDETWWESSGASKELKRLVCAEKWEISDSIRMGIENSECFIFLKYTAGRDGQALLSDLEAEACELVKKVESAGKNLYIINIVDNMKSRVFLEKTFLSDEGKALKKTIRKAMPDRKSTVNFLYIMDNRFAEQDIKLVNINRFDFIQMPPMKDHINWEGKRQKEGQKSQETANSGYVTSAPLCQLVEIYNKIGDKLFKRNVRYGLNEQLGVDRAIKETLRNSPQDFWFKNNGITILVERPDFKLDRVGEVLLEHITEYGSLRFSVINGAQTITASAQCLYEMEYELEELKQKGNAEEAKALMEKIKRSREAMVLLRIIHIPHRGQNASLDNGSAREVNEISVALNRQKPIKAEDIAFASPFVEKLAAFLEREQLNGKRYFKLVKRGEGNITNRSIDLVDFARARKACAGSPGEARTKGTNILLSSKNEIGGEYQFRDTAIFVPEWMEAEEEQEAEVFKKYYGAVSFTVRVADFYGKNVKKVKAEDPDTFTVLQNGKWYFTAYLVQLFNGFQKYFSQFTDCFELIRGNLTDLMMLFADQCVMAAKSSGKFTVLDSNTFKTDELYQLINEKADRRLFAELINRDLGEEEQIEFHWSSNAPFAGDGNRDGNENRNENRNRNEHGNEDEHGNGDDDDARFDATGSVSTDADAVSTNADTVSPTSAAPAPAVPPSAPLSDTRPQAAKTKFIQLNGGPIERVSSTAHAMVKTVQYVLDNYPDCERDLLVTGWDWFTNDQTRVEEGYGYLRRTVEVTGSDGSPYWVGTHSNTNVKYNQIRDLCRMAGVKSDNIRWLSDDMETQLFAW